VRVEILCHRGWWSTPDERNSRQALSRAFAAGLGVETDLRDLAGRILVSHDPPQNAEVPGSPGKPVDLAELLALHTTHGHTTSLALNVKADGLAVPVAKALADAGLTAAAYAFDMSVPDQLAWLRTGVPVFTRHSDLEPEPVLYHQADGVWLDDFGPRRWWTAATIESHLRAAKRVAVVSPELHGRDHRDAWDALLGSGLAQADGLALCTDHPEAALEAFR
jgi:hypothetical protein